GLAQGACRVDHVVHNDAIAAVDFADDVHDLGHIGARAAFVDDGQVGFKLLGQCPRPHHAADVGRYDHQVAVVATPDVAQQNGACVDVVDRDVEETLDLVGVQVHGHDAVNAHHLQHVGHDLGRNGHACRPRAAVLACIAKIRDG